MEIICAVCKRAPEAINEYVEISKEEGLSPREFVIEEEGTFNPSSGQFYCTADYIKVGMPLGVAP